MKSWTLESHQQNLAEFSQWEWNFAQLTSLVQAHGHQYSADPQVAEWLGQQSYEARRRQLSTQRVERFRALGVDLTTVIPIAKPAPEAVVAVAPKKSPAKPVGHWDRRHERLMAWKRSGDGGDRVSWKELKKLLGWVNGQLGAYKRGALPTERREKLANVGWFWNEDGTPLFGLGTESQKGGKEAPTTPEAIWQMRFAKAAAWQQQHGRLHPSKTRDASLYEWCKRQRKLCREGTLSETRREQLDSIGFEWIPQNRGTEESGSVTDFSLSQTPPHGEAWRQRLVELQAFRDKHGHARATGSLDRSLAKWCGRQREANRAGQLSSERRQLLDDLGFEWNPLSHTSAGATSNQPEILAALWQQRFEELRAFHQQHGHARPRKSQQRALSKWCSRQREANRAGQLSFERREQLDGLGFEWNPARHSISTLATSLAQTLEALWQSRFAELQAFYQQHNHAHPSKAQNAPLTKWSERQREAFRKGKMTDERRVLLESIGFVWVAHRASAPVRPKVPSVDPTAAYNELWQQHFGELQAFHQQMGHARPTKPKHPSLAKWCERQREAYREGRLINARRVQLESLGFVFVHERRAVIDQQLPHTSLSPIGNAEPVGSHVATEQVPELQRVETETSESDESWKHHFSQLRHHVLQYGHSNVPRSRDAELHDWCVRQAQDQNEGSLAADRTAQLSALGFEPNYYASALRA